MTIGQPASDTARLNHEAQRQLRHFLGSRDGQLEKFAVTGSRSWFDWATVWSALSFLPADAIMFNGMGGGLDCLARTFWLAAGRIVRPFPAAWGGGMRKAAGHVRNTLMMENMPQLVLGFLADDAPSPGTRDALRKAVERGIPVFTFHQRIPPEQLLTDGDGPRQSERVSPVNRGSNPC